MKKIKSLKSSKATHYSVSYGLQRAFVYILVGSYTVENAYYIYSLLSEDGIDNLSDLGYFSISIAVPIAFLVIAYVLSSKTQTYWSRMFEATLFATIGYALWATLTGLLNYIFLSMSSVPSTEVYYYAVTAAIVAGYSLTLYSLSKKRA